jgi:DNA-binding response OmpR family regulator
VRGQIESHFEYYWRHLTPQEQYALITLPLIQGQEIYREHLMSLASLCLIAECNGHYRYFSPLFRDFVRRQIVDHVLQAGPVTLDLKCQRGLLREEPLELSSREFALLKYLMQHQGQVVSNEELDREVLASTEEQPNYVYAYNEERLKSAIRELRKALGDETIRLVNQRGVGYMLQIPTEE